MSRQVGWTAAAAALALTAWAQDGEQSPKDELGKAAKETGKLESYSFRVEFDVEGAPGGMAERPPVEGRYRKNEGLYVKIGDYMEVARKGGKTAWKRGGGEWEEIKPRRGGGEGEGGGEMPGGADFERLMAQIKAPHEEMEGFEKRFKEIERTSETERIGREDARLFRGPLTDQGVKDSLPFKDLMDGILRWIPNAKIEGKAKAWVGENGKILKFEIDTSLVGDFNGAEFEVTFLRTVELSDLNDAKPEIPDEAKKILETESAKPKK
jgi:hypothetical protein